MKRKLIIGFGKIQTVELDVMQMSIASNIKSALPKTDNAKELMKFVEEHSQTADKFLAGTLISTLTTMKFDGSRTMQEHVIEMKNIATRLNIISSDLSLLAIFFISMTCSCIVREPSNFMVVKILINVPTRNLSAI